MIMTGSYLFAGNWKHKLSVLCKDFNKIKSYITHGFPYKQMDLGSGYWYFRKQHIHS